MSKDLVSLKSKDRILSWRQSIKQPRRINPPKIKPQSSVVSLASHHTEPKAPATPRLPLDERYDWNVGPNGRVFTIRKPLFQDVTDFFHDTNVSRVVYPMNLTEGDPQVFHMFTDWLYHPQDPRPYIPLQYSEEPWRSHAVSAWVLGEKVHSAKFERYALSHIITNCVLFNLSTWEYIEKKAGIKSSLRRFSNHWVAWSYHLADKGQSEYENLLASRLATKVGDDTNDPRVYDLDHWYSLCGDDINSACIHDPVVRENSITELFRSREPKPEWGRDSDLGDAAD